MTIRPACAGDAQAILDAVLPAIRAGTSYALDPDMNAAQLLDYWLGPDKETFVAEDGGAVLGTYYLRANQAGGGRHVCNCGYVTAPAASGKGIARAMCEHSLDHARSRGFRAMQFNFVVSTNTRAVQLWQALGFGIAGRLPEAFNHPTEGFVDALVMYRRL